MLEVVLGELAEVVEVPKSRELENDEPVFFGKFDRCGRRTAGE